MIARVFYTDKLPSGVGGQARGPLVFIRFAYRGDQGLHQHELLHVEQFWRAAMFAFPLALLAFVLANLSIVDSMLLAISVAVLTHPALYQFVKRYRMWSESSAYRRQTLFPASSGVPMSCESAALYLTNPRYRLDITYDQALAIIKEKP